jgi:hypothetical protein
MAGFLSMKFDDISLLPIFLYCLLKCATRRGRGKYAAVNMCVISEKGDVFVRRIGTLLKLISSWKSMLPQPQKKSSQ